MYFNFQAKGWNIKTEWIQLNCILLFPLEDFLLIVIVCYVCLSSQFQVNPCPAEPGYVLPLQTV